MKAWLRRILYLLLILLWLVLVLFPLGAFLLASRGELQLGSDPKNHVRIFLLQEDRAQGVAVEWMRPSQAAPDCHQSSVSYLLWEGDGENVVYCQCSDSQTGELKPVIFEACSVPQ